MKIKKYFVGFIASTMLVSTCYCIKPVEAIDFSKDESKYMSLCASGKLTNSNKKTCEEFNSYLKAKNKKLKKDLELVVDYGLGDESSKWDKIYGEYAKSTLKFMQELQGSDSND